MYILYLLHVHFQHPAANGPQKKDGERVAVQGDQRHGGDRVKNGMKNHIRYIFQK